MILRVLGEGQFEVDEATVDALNQLDDEVLAAVESGDEEAFKNALLNLRERVVQAGTPVPDDYLGPSELILPAVDSSIADVKEMLGDEGLIPD